MHIKDDKRPWGSFRQYTENEPSTIKLINIESDQRLSLQYHNYREEFWVILSGDPSVMIDGKITDATAGDEFFIPKNAIHRIEAHKNNVQILEMAFGDFDENDIVRIEDSYGRIA